MFVRSLPTHILQKESTGIKLKQAHIKNRSLTHAPQPTVIQISVLPFCSIKWTIFSSCLTWLFEYFLKRLHCCVMETLQLYGNCLIPVLVISCSPGSLGLSLSLSLHRFIFPCAPHLHYRCYPGMPPQCSSPLTIWYTMWTTWHTQPTTRRKGIWTISTFQLENILKISILLLK